MSRCSGSSPASVENVLESAIIAIFPPVARRAYASGQVCGNIVSEQLLPPGEVGCECRQTQALFITQLQHLSLEEWQLLNSLVEPLKLLTSDCEAFRCQSLIVIHRLYYPF